MKITKTQKAKLIAKAEVIIGKIMGLQGDMPYSSTGLQSASREIRNVITQLEALSS